MELVALWDDLITFRFRNGRCCRQHDGIKMAVSLSRHSLNLNVYKKGLIKWFNSAINRTACSALVCRTFWYRSKFINFTKLNETTGKFRIIIDIHNESKIMVAL